MEYVWKYQQTGWVQQNNLRGRYGASLVLLENILLLVGGGQQDRSLRFVGFNNNIIEYRM